MKNIYFTLTIIMLSITAHAQLTVKNLVNFVDCNNYSCIAAFAHSNGYQFADSTFDDEYKLSRYYFTNTATTVANTPQNTLMLMHDGIANVTSVNFETLTEDYYRQLVNDITANGFVVDQILVAGSTIYNIPGTKLFVFVETDTYEDGLHYAFTLNYRPGELDGPSVKN